jgi:acyl carrier protein
MTQPDDVRGRCVEVFSQVFGADPASITDATSPDNLEGWDSLGHVQLVVAAEKAFGIEIAPDEAMELENFRGVVDLIARKR